MSLDDRIGPRTEREVISPAPSPSFPFSRAIGFGDLVFVSGSIGRHPKTGQIAPDIKGQTTQVMENILHELELAGTSMAKVLKATIFIVDMNHFQTMNDAYRRFFSADPPARSCVEVTALPDREALVEIEVVAGR